MGYLNSYRNLLVLSFSFFIILKNLSIVSLAVLGSTSSESERVHIAHVNILEDGPHFNGSILIHQKLNQLVRLRKPNTSVFSKNFRIQFLEKEKSDTDTGNKMVPVPDVAVTTIREITPSQSMISSAEGDIYVDKETDAAFKVQIVHEGGGEKRIRLNGFIKGYHIQYDGEKHIAKLFEPQTTPGIQIPIPIPPTNPNANANEQKSRHENGSNKSEIIAVVSVSSANPEVLLFIDYKLWSIFENHQKLFDYLSVFIHSVNNRFANMKDPMVALSLAGVVTATTRNQQEFLELNKLPDNTTYYDINGVLSSFSSFLFSQKDVLMPHDIAALLSGEDFVAKGPSGDFEKGASVAGLAYIGGACQSNEFNRKAVNTLIIHDNGVSWLGIQTAVHEFAHNLGAPHDGQGDAEKCSWDDGYIMSYNGYGTGNKFYFSQCSQNSMKAFVDSKDGLCLKVENSEVEKLKISQDFPGDRLSMDEQCRIGTRRQDAVRDSSKSESDQCKRLYCKYEETCGAGCTRVYSIALGSIPGDNTPCGGNNNGMCLNGECIVNSTL